MDCCNSIYKFCESVSPCSIEELFDLIFSKYTTAGAYILKLYFLESCTEKEITIGLEGITFTNEDDALVLNENYFYKTQLLNLDGEVISIVEGHDCFSFKTKYCF